MGNLWKTTSTGLGAMVMASFAAIASPQQIFAQETLPMCESPEANEFLVLVFTPSPPLQNEVRLQVGRTLPDNHDLLVCQYGDNVLSRIGGFESQKRATAWAEYFDDAVGLPLMVITPVEGETAQNVVAKPPEIPSLSEASPPEIIVPTTAVPDNFQQQLKPERDIPVSSLAIAQSTAAVQANPFQPQAMTGGGYGILVDYGVNPQIAGQLNTLLNREVGLVVYATRGYLLAAQTQDAAQATTLLDQLNQNGMLAIAVPANQLILLKANVNP